jgi:hypothetical protein
MAGLVVPRQALSNLLSDVERDHVWASLGAAHLARVDANAAAVMKDFVKGVLEIAQAHAALNHPARDSGIPRESANGAFGISRTASDQIHF